MSALTGSPFSSTGDDDLDGPGDRGPGITKAGISLICLSTLAVSLRLYSRKLIKVRLLESDWVLIVALVLTIAFSVVEIVAAHHGLGKHILRTNFLDDILLLKILFTEGVLYVTALTSTKLSILLLYRTIFPTSPTRAFRVGGYIVATLCICWGISTLLGSIFSCTPISDYWNVLNPNRHCLDQYTWYLITSIINIVTDAMILVLPVASVWQLQLNWKAKISVSALFLLGGFVVVASTIRLVILIRMAATDITWNYYSIAIWSLIEVNMAVISSCLPTMRPVLLAATPWLAAIGLSLRSFIPGASGRRQKGYNSAPSSRSANSVGGRRGVGAHPGAMPAYASTDIFLQSLHGRNLPYCETHVQGAVGSRRDSSGKRGPKRAARTSDEEMVELVLERTPPEGEILVQKDVVQTWNRTDTPPEGEGGGIVVQRDVVRTWSGRDTSAC